MIPVPATAPPRAEPHPEPVVPEDDVELSDLWEDAPGLPGFFTTVDHKRIGIRYLVTAVIFLLLGGIEAGLIRMQLARPNGTPMNFEAMSRAMP